VKEKRLLVPKREAEVGQRLRKFRDHIRLTQQEFAEQIGITRQRLASYEELRVALRWDLALRICRHFILSEKWLARGQGLMRQCMDLISEPLSYRIPVDAPFGLVYDEYLSPLYEEIKQQHGDDIRIKIEEGANVEFIENLLRYLLDFWMKELPKTKGFPEHFPQVLCAFLVNQGFGFINFTLAVGRLPGDGDMPKLIIPLTPQSPPVKRKKTN
jgi:DNA-binding XRE family transcriptional regulator